MVTHEGLYICNVCVCVCVCFVCYYLKKPAFTFHLRESELLNSLQMASAVLHGLVVVAANLRLQFTGEVLSAQAARMAFSILTEDCDEAAHRLPEHGAVSQQ